MEAVSRERPRVMLVDDSRAMRRGGRALLEQCGCSPLLAEDGFQALCQLAECRPDVLLLDTAMPRLNGFQTCALIRESAHFSALPVVLLCSDGGLLEELRAEFAGASACLSKPFSRQDLLGVLEKVLRSAAGPPESMVAEENLAEAAGRIQEV